MATSVGHPRLHFHIFVDTNGCSDIDPGADESLAHLFGYRAVNEH